MKLYQLFIVSVIILNASCRKITHNTDVSGSVYDANTFASIPGAKVAVLKAKSGCFTCPGTVVVETTTDSEGRYELEFKSEKEYTYSMAALKDNYFEELGGNVYLDKDKKNKKVAIPLSSKAYLRLKIRNAQPFDSNDLIRISGDWNCCSPQEFYGVAVDTNVTDTDHINGANIVYGNRNTSINYVVIKNGIQNNYSITVYCPAFDTTTFTINY